MAERPVFVPRADGEKLVEEAHFAFAWNKGLAPSQKKKNVAALHASAASQGLAPLLEVSTKSEEPIGQRLSAFNLKVPFEGSYLPLESAFQGSKVFERGGPFTELYSVEVREAKRDPRLRESGRIVAFQFGNAKFPVIPQTAFYDWLYIRAATEELQSLEELSSFAGFTDIEFNPKRSINCQARSCAMLVALDSRRLVAECVASAERFIQLLRRHTASSAQACLLER